MALFKILKGQEKNLPANKTEGWAYVTTDEGNMYVDVSASKRVRIGAHADKADVATKAEGDTNSIRATYLAKLKQVTSNGTTFTFRGETGDGSDAADLITIPLAGDKAGLISNAAQTIKGNKTFANGISFPTIGTWPTPASETYPIKSQGLSWSGSSDNAAIFYEVQASDKGMLVIESGDDTNAGLEIRNAASTKKVTIIDGLVTGAFKGNLSGTASRATSDVNGKNITSYIASVLAQSDNRTIRVTTGDGTTNDIKLYFAASSSFGGDANSALTVGQGNDPNTALNANDLVINNARSKKTFYATNTDKMTNRPSGTNWGYLDVGSYGTGYTSQMFINGANADTYVRVRNNTWGAWKQFAFTDGTIKNAQFAEKDSNGNIIYTTYLKDITSSTATDKFTFKGIKGDGSFGTVITIPGADTGKAGLVTTGAQTIAGTKTFNGGIVTRPNSYKYDNGFGINLQNSDIIGANSIYFNDVCDSSNEGIQYIDKSGTYRTLWATGDGILYWSGAHAANTGASTNYVVVHSGNFNTYDDYITAFAWTGGTTSGPTATITRKNGTTISVAAIPSASGSASGIITTGAQTIAGEKTLTNNLRFSNITTGVKGIIGTIADNDYWRVIGGANASNQGYLEIATADDANEPIYVRQYSGVFATLKRTLTLLDANGNTRIPGSLFDKNGQELKASLFIASLFQKTSNGTTFTFGGKNTAGTELSTLTIPNASASVAGLITNAAQTLGGNKTFTGDIYISHGTTATMTYNTTNPKLVFSENGGQPVGIVYTDYDSYRNPAGLKVMSTVSNNGKAWFEVEGSLYVGGDIYDKQNNILLASKYVAQLVGSQGNTNYTITPQNQNGSNLTNILNVPINLVGSANTNSKIFLVGTTSQSATAQTGYSHDTVYIDSDGFLYDSGNKPSYHSRVSIGNTNNYKWHRIARTNEIKNSWHDGTILLYISQDYNGGSYGLLRVSLRTNNISSRPDAYVEGEWIARSGFSLSNFKLALYSAANKVYADLYYISPGSYAGITVKQIQQGSRGSLNQNGWFLTNSSEANDTTASDKKASTSYKDITAAQTGLRGGVAYTSVQDTVDDSRVNNANYADRAQYDWNGNDIRKKYIATLAVKTTNGTTFTFKGSSMSGDELSAITIPAASASVAGLITNTTQTIAGAKTLQGNMVINPGALSNYQEGLRICNANNGWTTLILGGTATSGTSASSWSLHTNGGNFYLTHNGSSSSSTGILQSDTNGNWQIKNKLGVNGQNIGYQFYVNGSSYFNGVLSAKSDVDMISHGNEFNVVPTLSGNMIFYFNYRQTKGNNTNGYKITQYCFCDGNGAVLASITNGKFNGTATAANYTTQLLGVNSSNTPYGATEGNLIRAVWNVKNDNRWYFKAGSYECRVGYANSANSATTATQLSSNDKMTYGWNGLNYFNKSMSVSSAAGANNSPTADWYHIIRMNHGNSAGYYCDIATCFHNNNMYLKRVAGGSSSGWLHIWVQGNSVTGAVWNDYAECRQAETQEAGYVLYETGSDDLKKTIERLQHFAGVSSDTWGFSQGETEKAKTPIAVAGRVLVYTYQDRNNYKPGDCVCAAPGGTVDIMTREEVVEYPDRIVGTVSCVPTYEEWGGGEGADRDPVKVNGRIWIKVR